MREKISHDEVEKNLLESAAWRNTVCMTRKITQVDLEKYIIDFVNYCREIEKEHDTMSDARKHFINQLPHIIKKYETLKSQNNRTSDSLGSSSRAETAARVVAGLAASCK